MKKKKTQKFVVQKNIDRTLPQLCQSLFSCLSLMELALAHFSSLRISAVTSFRSTYLYQTKTPIKPNCISSEHLLKTSNKFPSFGLYRHRTGFKHASKQRNFIWVCFAFCLTQTSASFN